ncbi:hypothetical protein [Amycolatopsis sp. SID8362]|uniref:hypothetical protein n=1 Tax=Amycolatopsis sp. SID8362 TaxID=2690346 RepID=UPI0013684530|nr:hypothetical protein [Amycolatopsis sp. SID8362]NBH01708.1 hypothetical protein [Amycolatopsis sp. SID8362]NED38409.1 hypothetical protein [Amycolatopsis sp. SID8362]
MMLRYLGSTKNLAGCVGGLTGVVLYLTGVVGWVWPFVVVALYLAGALLAPGEKVRLVPDTSASLRASLETLVASVTAQSSRLPSSSVDTVRRIAEVLSDLLSRPDRLAADPDLRHAVVRLAGTDLPLSVQTYLNLPWWFAARRASAGEELVAQLGLLETEAHRVAERFYATEIDRQADHTRYLRDRDA